ncbi:MAG TPA: low temperature requirement protein A [Nocardioides sp.]|uniref:low temperature requirement protein A n=1 Tax=Nocardioides sp. TaxID=35761 RepID=UPI002E377B59|nr:low temperature requirement protein A [Nocardioides sp.]HEX5087412.1 low temperature requirement protein A [Nocardioides sp.]
MPEALMHTVRRMVGRDPREPGRASTPLELLFDLTFVIAFGAASDELAHAVAEDHVAEGVLAFCLATFAVTWAWINFTWFASAYDTDDWPFRLTTMVQMLGVLILALGVPDMFASVIEHDGHLDLRLIAVGYVIMRLPMVAQWLRAGRSDPARRALCSKMVWTLVAAQAGWILLVVLNPSMRFTVVAVVVLVGVEVLGPVLAETMHGGSPWHGHHVAERYGLMVIIALGEGLLGTTAALGALVEDGWTVDAAILGLAGTALTFGVWWTYFVVPWGHLLTAYRHRSFGWGYGHIPMFGAIVAIGAGLHVAAYYLDDESHLDATGTVLAVALPLAVYAACLYLLYAQITRTLDPFHMVLIAGTAALVVIPVVLATAGVDMVWCLAVLALSPWVTVVGYETVGHRHNARVLAAIDG